MELMCFTSAKGGVGTSFAVACVAYALSKSGKRCLVADLHGGCRTLDIYMGSEGDFVFDMHDVLYGSCSFEDAVVHVRDGCDFISSPQHTEFEDADYIGIAEILHNSCTEYDYVLLDCPASFATSRAADGCSKVIVVTGCDKASVRCTEKLVCQMQTDSDKFLVINNIIPELVHNGYHNNIDDICDLCGVAPIGLIPCEPLAATGDPLLVMEDEALAVSQAFCNVAQRIQGNSVYAVSFDRKTPFYKLLKKYSGRKN